MLFMPKAGKSELVPPSPIPSLQLSDTGTS